MLLVSAQLTNKQYHLVGVGVGNFVIPELEPTISFYYFIPPLSKEKCSSFVRSLMMFAQT